MGRLLRIIKQTPFGPVAVLYEYGTQTEVYQGTVDDAKKYAADLGDEIVETITEGAGAIAGISLEFIHGLGEAIIVGLDNGYDAIAAKLSGKESAVISGMTVATIGILTVVFLFNAAKSGKV